MKHILHSSLLSRFPQVVQGTSTKDFGPLSFTYEKQSNTVIIDRVRFLDSLGLDASHSVLVCEQNHTANMIVIRDEHKVHGLFEQSSQLADADGMVTDIPGINLVVYTADCMPISFYDPVAGAIGIAHSGWKGTIGDISRNIVTTMQREYGSKPSDIRVAIGPSIGPCCYSVKNPEQIRLFDEKYQNNIPRNGDIYVDLWSAVEKDLLDLGIRREHIENPRICTACHHDIYASHRADNPNTTANLTVISMRD